MSFLVKRTEDAKDLPLPSQQTKESSGMDLYANVHGDVCLKKGERVLIPTGIQIALPGGYEAQIRSRSGLAFKSGVVLLGGVGTVDADYRGQIHALLINHGDDDFIIKRGDRIAQMVIAKVAIITFEETDALPESERGSSGFGSTGV